MFSPLGNSRVRAASIFAEMHRPPPNWCGYTCVCIYMLSNYGTFCACKREMKRQPMLYIWILCRICVSLCNGECIQIGWGVEKKKHKLSKWGHTIKLEYCTAFNGDTLHILFYRDIWATSASTRRQFPTQLTAKRRSWRGCLWYGEQKGLFIWSSHITVKLCIFLILIVYN